MNLRRSFLWASSAALTVFLIVLLIKISKLDLRVTVQQLRSVSWVSFTKLVLLTGLHVYLSSLKWRRVDASLRRSSDSAPSRTMSFALTSTGVALGQILPVQLSMSAARTLGTYFHGRAVKRGTGGTLFEQAFDVLIVGFLVIASGVTRFYRGGGLMWTVCAFAMTGFAMLAIGPSVQFIRRQVFALNARPPTAIVLQEHRQPATIRPDEPRVGPATDGSFGSAVCHSGADGRPDCRSDRRPHSALAFGGCDAVRHYRLCHRGDAGGTGRE